MPKKSLSEKQIRKRLGECFEHLEQCGLEAFVVKKKLS